MGWGLAPAENSSAAAVAAAAVAVAVVAAPPGGRSGNLRFLHDRALEQRSRRDTTGKSLRITLRVFYFCTIITKEIQNIVVFFRVRLLKKVC